ncbi:DNA-3-methyladenine glycosylase [Arsenicicoccus piscis]|uniref:DNA-3-methyladenine glycosylase n=1 Tax=Arsenicicoccus piscis TaxID=673954 RepID=UPI001F4D1F5C|nr:DNA-3-methyladenine glycosylase [Arsenicicoccus piscis]
MQVAPELLGCVLHRGPVAIRLTEVEAYEGAQDPGAHSFRGRTARNASMFGPPGHFYVYFTYGMHHAINAVCQPEGTAAGVLLRAGEVVAGQDLVAERRAGIAPRDWARGPGRLAAALDLDRASHDGHDGSAADAEIYLTAPEVPIDPALVRTGPRVGVSGPGGDGTVYPWRFWLDGEPTVSAYRPAVRRRRS